MATDNLSISDVVLTQYGSGVIVDQVDDFVVVRLWRIPGKSVGSAAKATLRRSAIISKLPAAPGMLTDRIVESGSERVLIMAYYTDQKVFLAKEVQKKESSDNKTGGRRESLHVAAAGEDQFIQIPAEELAGCKSAKFYPILETLMLRGDQASGVAGNIIGSSLTKRIIDQSGVVVREGAQKLGDKSGAENLIDEAVTTVQSKTSNADAKMDEVLKMVKDEELTSLLGSCRARLEQMVTTDLPEVTKSALQRSGIRLRAQEDSESLKPRQAALDAMNQLLDNVRNIATVEEQEEISENFSEAFKSLNVAAQSDRNLAEIVGSISEKTTEWQKLTGQLLETRSAGLFLEGASRLQARVGNIFNENQSLLESVGAQWTKAFTEGDTAIATLKSVELGDAVKNRLVDAIQVRSESAGGLDGIIAGALSSVQGSDNSANIQNILKNLQGKATSVSEDAKENFISLVSKRSAYQDVALLHVEEALCNLDSQLGDSLSAEALASVSRGEGGTAQLFQPIAERAAKEIDAQLSIAESQVTDAGVLEILKKVRKLASGELPLSSLMDEVVDLLNNEDVVAAGETLVQQGEVLLDAIEGVSGNQMVDDAIQIAGKAGISKESVMKEVEKLDVNSILDTAGSAVSDENARIELLSSATDTALDFVLRILPSMPVPPFEGVKDGLIYNIANLSLEGFKVKKEDIHIKLAGMQATRSSFQDETNYVEGTSEEVKATELLIVDIQHVSAVIEGAAWGFEQTYMPYLKGSGTADVAMSNGRIRLQFELRRRKNKDGKWEPVLCLHDRTCTIGEVEMKLQGESRLTWILNKLASVFKGPLRDYVVRTIVNVLTNQSGWILSRLNQVLSSYWELILRTSKLNMNELLEADESVVVEESCLDTQTLIELVWRDQLPLGMNLLTNDESGFLKVVDFPRGSQARGVCERRQLDPDIFKGARIVAVNGTQFESQEDLFDALRDPGRPKTVMLAVANAAEAKSVADFVNKPEPSDTGGPKVKPPREFVVRNIKFDAPGDLGIEFSTTSDGFALEVVSFPEGDGGIVGAVERSGKVRKGELLTHVNGKSAVGLGSDGHVRAVQLLAETAEVRPIELGFAEPYFRVISLDRRGDSDLGGPKELELEQNRLEDGSLRVNMKSLAPVSGAAESGGILIGDHLVFVNGVPVGVGARWLGEGPAPGFDAVLDMLQDPAFYPIGLTFGRPRRKESRWEVSSDFSDSDAETSCVTAESFTQLGCVFRTQGRNEVVVSDFNAVPGSLSHQLSGCQMENFALESINGEIVPSYASVSMVQSALTRSWKNDRFELVLCDDEQRAYLRSLETGSE